MRYNCNCAMCNLSINQYNHNTQEYSFKSAETFKKAGS